jgi:hypothetical protein
MDLSDKQIDIFQRLGRQLELTKKLLEQHPLVSDRFKILQNVLNNFSLQTAWSSSSKVARLLMTFEMALNARSTEESASGFAGPIWLKMQNAEFLLMNATLSLTERRQAHLLLTLNEMMGFGIIFITTQVLGNWNRIFDQRDKATAKKAGLLLRELGLTFLLRSGMIQTVYNEVAKGLELSDKSQKKVTDIGLFFLLLIMILVDAEDHPTNEDLIEAFLEPLKQTISSVEFAATKAEEQGMVNQELATLILSQLQLIRQTLESDDLAAIKQVIENSLEAFNVPYNELKQDLTSVIHVCDQINECFNNIFFQSKLTMTTMTQTA